MIALFIIIITFCCKKDLFIYIYIYIYIYIESTPFCDYKIIQRYFFPNIEEIFEVSYNFMQFLKINLTSQALYVFTKPFAQAGSDTR